MVRVAVSPLSQVSLAWPPTRRSTSARLPNQVPRPSAVVSAAQTRSGGWASCEGALDPVGECHVVSL